MAEAFERDEERGPPWRERWRDYYAVLGVDRRATQDEVERAAAEKAVLLQAHRFMDAPAEIQRRAEQERAILQQAYNVLRDPELRELYDEEFDRLTSFRGRAGPAAAGALEETAAPGIAIGLPAEAGQRDEDLPVDRKPWGMREGLIGLGIGVALVILVSIPLSAVASVAGGVETIEFVAASIVATGIVDLLLVGAVFALAVRRYRLSLRAFGFRFAAGQWWIPVVATFGIMVANAVYSATLQGIGADFLTPEQELDDLFQSRAILPLTGFFSILIAPFAEETFFRGFLFPALIGRLRVWGAALVTGLLFGLVHVTSMDTLGLVIPFGAIGIALAWLYYRTGSLWVSIGTHLLINTVSFAVLASGAVGNS